MAVTPAQKRAAVDLAAAAYLDETNPGARTADVQAALGRIPAAANGPWTLVWGPSEIGGILGYVARSADGTAYAVAFRGSLGELAAHDFFNNWAINAETFAQVPWPFPVGGGVQVSSGMLHALGYVALLIDNTTKVHLLDFLRPLVAASGLDLIVTGHSLGGALAQLAALWLHQQLVTPSHGGVHILPMTFAAPTTGNQQFATLYEHTFPDNYALVNQLDIVPMAWCDLDRIQRQYPPPAQTVAEFGATIAGLLTVYKDSLAQAYRPVVNPPPETFGGWMPASADKFANTMEQNHAIAIYRGHVVWETQIP